MEESVALDSSKQKQFVKSVRGIKKLLKKKSKKSVTSDTGNKTVPIEKPEPTKKIKSEKKPKLEKNKKKTSLEEKKPKTFKKRGKRGLVYLAHIPHGFYEHQMTEYFKQFGVVTNARVIRSSRTGNSKGYAFVEFKEPSVAEIVAETMNNYLMGKRLLKAVYIPPEKQKLHALRKNWNNENNPARDHTLKMKRAINADKTDQEELLVAEKLLSSLSNNKKKLKVLGIDYDFFMPVDVPEGLKEKVEKVEDKVKEVSSNTGIESKKKIKVEEKITKTQQKKIKNEPTENKNNIVSLKKENNKNKKQQNKNKNNIKSNENQPEKKNLIQGVDIQNQTNKQQKLKVIELKADDFININNSDDDDDDSVDFDSDEFEKMIENDDDEDVDDEDVDDEDLSEADESDDLNKKVTQKKHINKKIMPIVSQKENSTSKTTLKNKQGKEIPKVMAEKRKKVIIAPVTSKKAKFEKQNKKTLNKVIKKRK
ncbi:MKI67 FHA domain-interacting nucleolar phosphoprotein-like [Vanessa atalanta]|uniref:MKI67 FHA domain-interacting nucleolar phosphoprotein-like n=1 Tax=Vanessa atalanta TaxID=42275 RepID=UPI001FCD389F|nr:MKI67 FHA domain-interacting nucleolar phosphoprotein-like [Vanessa atalanta]